MITTLSITVAVLLAVVAWLIWPYLAMVIDYMSHGQKGPGS